MKAKKAKPPGILVLIPTRGVICAETTQCLVERMDGFPHKILYAVRLPMIEALDCLARQVREIDVEALPFDPKYVLILSDDVVWAPGLVKRMYDLAEAKPDDVDVLTALSCRRDAKQPPMFTPWPWSREKPFFDPDDYQDGQLVKIVLGTFMFALGKREIFDKVREFHRLPMIFPKFTDDLNEYASSIWEPKPHEMPEQYRDKLLPEDYSFCVRAWKAGFKICTERNLTIGHLDAETGLLYYPNCKPMLMQGDKRVVNFSAIVKSEAREYFSDASDAGENVWQRDLPFRKAKGAA